MEEKQQNKYELVEQQFIYKYCNNRYVFECMYGEKKHNNNSDNNELAITDNKYTSMYVYDSVDNILYNFENCFKQYHANYTALELFTYFKNCLENDGNNKNNENNYHIKIIPCGVSLKLEFIQLTCLKKNINFSINFTIFASMTNIQTIKAIYAKYHHLSKIIGNNNI